MSVVAFLAWAVGLVPLIWLVAEGERRREWWWLASALGVSFLADLGALLMEPHWASAVYPVLQASLVGAVVLSRENAAAYVALLIASGWASLQLHQSPDWLLHTVSYLGCAFLAYHRAPGRLKEALVLYFGLGWLAWLSYVLSPGWASWGTFQGIRALGILWFCLAQQEKVYDAAASH